VSSTVTLTSRTFIPNRITLGGSNKRIAKTSEAFGAQWLKPEAFKFFYDFFLLILICSKHIASKKL
jgi:hypothetical protein